MFGIWLDILSNQSIFFIFIIIIIIKGYNLFFKKTSN